MQRISLENTRAGMKIYRKVRQGYQSFGCFTEIVVAADRFKKVYDYANLVAIPES